MTLLCRWFGHRFVEIGYSFSAGFVRQCKWCGFAESRSGRD